MSLLISRSKTDRAPIILKNLLDARDEGNVAKYNEWLEKSLAYFQACPKQGGIDHENGNWSCEKDTKKMREIRALYNACEDQCVHIEYFDHDGSKTVNRNGLEYKTRWIKHSFAGIVPKGKSGRKPKTT